MHVRSEKNLDVKVFELRQVHFASAVCVENLERIRQVSFSDVGRLPSTISMHKQRH
jgi:hypothetical protein